MRSVKLATPVVAVTFLSFLVIFPAGAQDLTQSMQQGYQLGRQMREAWDANKAAKEEARRAEEARRQADENKRKTEEERRQAEGKELQRQHDAVQMQLAYSTPSTILVSRNGLPEIRLSNVAANGCDESLALKAAFTHDAQGKVVAGCALIASPQFSVVWQGYGEKTYLMSEWDVRQPLDSDHAPLGGQ